MRYVLVGDTGEYDEECGERMVSVCGCVWMCVCVCVCVVCLCVSVRSIRVCVFVPVCMGVFA